MDEGWLDSSRFLEKIRHIHGHLLNGGVVECLNVPQGSLVILSHHVDGYALSAKTTTATNPDRREKKLKFSSEQRLAYGAKRQHEASISVFVSYQDGWCRFTVYGIKITVNSGQLCLSFDVNHFE